MKCDSLRAKLDAYSDGELCPSESTEVARHLKQCPDCTSAALENAQMKRSIALAGKRYAPSAEFRAKIMRGTRWHDSRTRRWTWKLILLPATLVILISVATSLYVTRETRHREHVYSELADLHVSALASSNPVDVLSTDRHTVKPWFEGKLPFTFNLPELQGTEFTLLGARVTYVGQMPGAQLIYRLRKHEISVFIVQERSEAAIGSSAVTEAFSFHVENWTHNGLRYFLVGDVSADDINSLSRLFRNAE